MLTAIVCNLSRVAEIPGAQKIKRAEASGYVVVVGADRTDGDLGVLLPAGGVVAPGFAAAAGLAHLHKGRVKEITLRGVRSEGVWIEWAEFQAAVGAWCSCDSSLIVGPYHGLGALVIDGGPDRGPLYEKYVPRTRRGARPPRGYVVEWSDSSAGDVWSWASPPDASGNIAGGGPYASEGAAIDAAWSHARPRKVKDPAIVAVFPELYETEALFRDAGDIPPGATCVATLKAHGESFRLGLVAPDGGPEALRGDGPCSARDGLWVGTRRMDFGPADELPEAGGQLGYLATLRDAFGPRLREGEVLYGEICGFRPNGAPVMKVAPGDRAKGHPYGARVTFSYGCAADGPTPDGAGYRPGDRWRPMIYRITVLEGGRPRELTRAEIVSRCAELLIEPVLELGRWEHVDVDATRDKARLLAEGPTGHLPDPLDPTHPREGVCVRWERGTSVGRAMKAKGFLFRALEGLVKDDGRLEREEAEALGLDPDDADGGEVQQ